MRAVKRTSRTNAASAKAPSRNVAESPLGWLYTRKGKSGAPMISDAQFDAGERLRRDFTLAHMTPRITVNWGAALGASGGPRSAPGAGMELQDHVIAAAERVRRALAAVGPELSGILVDVCCHLKGLEEAERSARWPQRSARVVLLLALDSLARHYGLDRGQRADDGKANIRHWGSDGYRPAIED